MRSVVFFYSVSRHDSLYLFAVKMTCLCCLLLRCTVQLSLLLLSSLVTVYRCFLSNARHMVCADDSVPAVKVALLTLDSTTFQTVRLPVSVRTAAVRSIVCMCLVKAFSIELLQSGTHCHIAVDQLAELLGTFMCYLKNKLFVVVVVVIAQQLFSYRQLSRLRKSEELFVIVYSKHVHLAVSLSLCTSDARNI